MILHIAPKNLILWQGPHLSNTIYLTFDDGPHVLFTEKVLEALTDHGVPATFFLIGKSVLNHPEIVLKTLSDGHEVGNHTFSHFNGSHFAVKATIREMDRTGGVIKALTGAPPTLIRPAFGRITLPFLFYAIKKRLTIVMWSFDSNDSFVHNEVNLISSINSVKGGDILLFHDDTKITVKNIHRILERLKKRGFQFGLIKDLLSNSTHSLDIMNLC